MEMAHSSNSSTGGGNTSPPPTKQISPCIKWSFTWNNYSEDDLSKLSSIVPDYCRFAIVGHEVGESGTPHLQGYLEFRSKRRPKSVFTWTNSIHWEKAKGTREDNVRYCSKDGNLKIQHGMPAKPKTISLDMMKGWQLEVLDQIKQEPDDRTIHWLWEPNGGVGKTSFLKYLVVHEDFTVLGGKAADCRNGVVEYAKAHNGQVPKRIGINVPRSFDPEYCSYEAFENLKDMLFYSGKYEGGMICGDCPHLYIFANFQPDIMKISEDRWIVSQIW